MAGSPVSDMQSGLPWPDDFADLQPEIRQAWGVAGEIYLVRRLSGGKSGAAVYAADLDSRDYAGQAILKFDRNPEPQAEQTSEAERHRLASLKAPDYAEAHLPRIVNTYSRDERMAILSTVAGRGLEYADAWFRCPYDRQLEVARTLSRGLLEDWNSGYALAAGLKAPAELLHAWLGYRLAPATGRIHSFLSDEYGVAPDQPTFLFDGIWFPNPLTFVQAPPPDDRRLRAVTGNVHGDLHGYNVLVAVPPGGAPAYYLIDLALYEADQYLFYDHAYFELTYLLRARDKVNPANWLSILEGIGSVGQGGTVQEGDDLGLVQLAAAVRRELFEWVDRHEGNRLSYMDSQALLARVAAGLSFTHKRISIDSRGMAFLYAAQSLKEYLKHNDMEWPKYGPPLVIQPRPQKSRTDVEPVEKEPPRPASAPAEPPSEDPDTEHFPLPDKPAVAVMAFESLGGDPEQEHFADGMTEDLVTELSRIDWLMVISSWSTLGYKGRAIEPQRVGAELGVHYVVTGSVRKAGGAVRVTAHLIDAQHGGEIWSERYDRKLEDVFAVQDEIAAAIVANIDSEAKTTEREEARRKRGPLNAWEIFQKGMWHLFKVTTDDDRITSGLMHRAIAAAPGFAAPHAMLSFLETRRFLLGLGSDPQEDLEDADRNAQEAIALDDRLALARIAHARVLSLRGDHDAAVDEAELAVRLNPSSATGYLVLAEVHHWRGRPAESLAMVERSLRLSPRDPALFLQRTLQAMCHADLGNLGEAEAAANLAMRGGPKSAFVAFVVAVVYVRQNRLDDARAAIDRAQRLRPDYTLSRLANVVANMEAGQRDHFLRDLRRAGLPE